MGRPSKLTKDVQKKIESAIAGGNYYEAACRYAGIDYQTFRNWNIEKGSFLFYSVRGLLHITSLINIR